MTHGLTKLARRDEQEPGACKACCKAGRVTNGDPEAEGVVNREVVAGAPLTCSSLDRLSDMSSLQCATITWFLMNGRWQEQIGSEFEKTYFHQLEKFVHQEWAGRIPIFPPKDGIFRAFNSTPFENIKVAIFDKNSSFHVAACKSLHCRMFGH